MGVVREAAKTVAEVHAVGTAAHAALSGAGVKVGDVAKYSRLIQDMTTYLEAHPEVQTAVEGFVDAYNLYDGSRKAFVAGGYMTRARALGLSSANRGFAAYGASGGGAVLQLFIKHFQAYASAQKIELNACAMAVARLSSGIAVAGIGTATALTGWGLVLAAAGTVEVTRASFELVDACRDPSANVQR